VVRGQRDREQVLNRRCRGADHPALRVEPDSDAAQV